MEKVSLRSNKSSIRCNIRRPASIATLSGLKGYNVHLIFFWLETPELAEYRVAERVRKGGHNIPTDVIHRRYRSGICNLFKIFMNQVDTWMIYDNSKSPRVFVAKGGRTTTNYIYSEYIFNKIKSYVR